MPSPAEPACAEQTAFQGRRAAQATCIPAHLGWRSLVGALIRQSQSLVLAGDDGSAILPAMIYRLLRHNTRLIVWADDAPSPWQIGERLALRLADGVLAANGPAAAAIATRLGAESKVFNVPGPYEIGAHLGQPSARVGAAARRIVVCDGLEPDGDGTHILHCAEQWAEQNPNRRLELVWIGDGDLRGVLAAQLLPDNLTQVFPGALTGPEIARQFAQSGVLIAASPARQGSAQQVLAQAMASGLVVVFDASCRTAARLLTHGHTGIGFDASSPAGVLDAIATTMELSDSALDTMRAAARMQVLPMDPEGFRDRLQRAIEAVMRGGATHPGSGRYGASPVAEAR